MIEKEIVVMVRMTEGKDRLNMAVIQYVVRRKNGREKVSE